VIAGFSAPDDLTVLAFLTGLGVFTVAVGAYVFFVPTAIEQRLAGFVGTYRPAAPAAGFDSHGQRLDLLGALDRQLRRRRQAASTQALLGRANVTLSVAELLMLRAGLALIAIGGVATVAVPRLGLPSVLLAAVIGLLASYLPLVYLGFQASRRLAALEAQLPDALDLIASSLQSGGAMTQSFALIVRDMPAPASVEFQRVLREVEIGLSVGEALTNFAERIGSEDLDLIVTTINIQLRVGGNLVQILRTINTTIRERIRVRGEIKVLTAMQRLSAYVLSAIPPALAFLIYLLDPEYIGRLFKPGVGLFLLIVSVIMVLLGFLVLQKITDIEV
jgi:tight adherence protein B